MAYNDEFSQGMSEFENPGRRNLMSPGLAGSSESWTNQVLADSSRPTSQLQPQLPGSNPGNLGIGDPDLSRKLPDGQLLPSGDGASEESYEAGNQLRLFAGQDGEV